MGLHTIVCFSPNELVSCLVSTLSVRVHVAIHVNYFSFFYVSMCAKNGNMALWWKNKMPNASKCIQVPRCEQIRTTIRISEM